LKVGAAKYDPRMLPVKKKQNTEIRFNNQTNIKIHATKHAIKVASDWVFWTEL